MRGPVAPKNPEKKRAGFYIMREKEVFGAPQEDGSGVQFLYESDGRLVNSARIVGNIQDEEMLSCLKSVEGFRSLVHSIGVSIDAKHRKRILNLYFKCMENRIFTAAGLL